MLYYLYIDESGDHDNYIDLDGGAIGDKSKYFTLGGIIVNEYEKNDFETAHQYLMRKYFKNIQLPENFKIHYHELRYNWPPYDKIQPNNKALADDIFKHIVIYPCNLLSVMINKENHCKAYQHPANVLAFALCLLLERFQHFLKEYSAKGEVIYESYNAKRRKEVIHVHKWLSSLPAYPTPIDITNLVNNVKNGDPSKEPLLQYADFFAFAPFIKNRSDNTKTDRYNQIKHRYYNLDFWAYFQRGNIEI
jgi:hypothetical protein